MRKKRAPFEKPDPRQIDFVTEWHLKEARGIKNQFGKVDTTQMMARYNVSRNYAQEIASKVEAIC